MTTETVTVRPLVEADLNAAVEIDKAIAGRARRGFMEKRLAAALRTPDRHIQVAAEISSESGGGALTGFALARIQDGEFGRSEPAVVLEALSVDPAQQHHGTGQALMSGIEEVMRHKGIRELQTQASWKDHEVLKFFDANGFRLARRTVVEIPVARVHEF